MATAAQQLSQVPADRHVFLAGRPPLGEFVGFMKTETVEGQTAEPGELAREWRAANARVRELEVVEAGAADDPPNHDLPPELAPLADRVSAERLVLRSFGMAPFEIKLVELNRLVVFQKKINLAHAGELGQLLGDDPSPEDLFHFCLPLDGRYDPATRAGVIATGPKGPQVVAMLSPSTDFRVLETVVLDPAQIEGLDSHGRPTHVIALVAGYGANYLSAIRVGRRVILKNGSHRAYALAANGIDRAPMLVQTVPEGEESEFLPPDVLQQPDLYLTNPRPPMLRDYLDHALRVVGHVPRNTKQVRAILNFEESYVPGG
jgi:hypothetical protein